MRNEAYLLEHLILQLFSSLFCPTQFSPPSLGAGLSQFRVLSCFPPVFGHLALHFDHSDHSPQPPSTEKLMIYLLEILQKTLNHYRLLIFKFLKLLYKLTAIFASIATDPSAVNISFITVFNIIVAMIRIY